MKHLSIMNTRSGIRGLAIAVSLLSSFAFGQYTVGESISQQTRDRTLTYCANAVGSETIGELLVPGDGEPTRVLWLSFFASW